MAEPEGSDTDLDLQIRQTLDRIRRNLKVADSPVNEQANCEPGHYFIPEALDGS